MFTGAESVQGRGRSGESTTTARTRSICPLRPGSQFPTLKKPDKFAVVINDRERANAISLHQLSGVVERGRRFYKESGSDGTHDISGARLAPTITRERLKIFKSEYSMDLVIERDGEGRLTMKREKLIDELCDSEFRRNCYWRGHRVANHD